MKQTFTFHSPPTIHFGIGALAKIKEAAPVLGKKALIISDETMRKLGHLETCQKHLNQIGVSPVIYDSVNSEPTDQHVAEAVQLFKRESCQSVLSLGGGSCIDAAKAVAILATNPLNVADLMDQRRIKNKPVSHIALPTTAGTGSEVTDVIVITHTDTQVKLMMKHSLFVPEVAIVDPKLTLSCPETVVAGTGIDAFCHAIEAYLSKKSHPMTNLYALSAMELIINNLQSAYDQPTDLKAKEAMSLAALQAGLAFSNASVCLIHGMSRPLGALFQVPHGISNAMLLNTILKFTVHASREKLAVIGEMFQPDQPMSQEQLANFALKRIEKITDHLKIPNLKTWGIEEQSFIEQLDKMAEDAIASGSPANHPIVPTKNEIKELYLESFDR